MMNSSDETQMENNTRRDHHLRTKIDTPDQPQQDFATTESSVVGGLQENRTASSENLNHRDEAPDNTSKQEHEVATTRSPDRVVQEKATATTVSVDAPVQPQALPPAASPGTTVDGSVAPFPELKTLHLANNLVNI